MAPKGPKGDSHPGVIRAHPAAPTEDMLQSLRDRELFAKGGHTTSETKTGATKTESPQQTSKSDGTRTPYDPEPEVSHQLDVLA